MYNDYFELQYKVITQLKPTVVGHFDLIRLLQPEDDIDPTTGKLTKDVNLEIDWPDIWQLVIRNIKFVKLYGGLFELNSSALRKVGIHHIQNEILPMLSLNMVIPGFVYPMMPIHYHK